MSTTYRAFITLGLIVLLSACGSGNSGPDTSSCPAWNVGDSFDYVRKTTIDSLPDYENEVATTLVITGRTNTQITLSSGSNTRTVSISNGRYITDADEIFSHDVLGAANNQFCPPPVAGDPYMNITFIPGEGGRGGDIITTSWKVAVVAMGEVSVPAGSFTARKINMAPADEEELPGATLTRYYVDGLGIVRQVEVIPSNGTTATFELSEYSFAP